MIFQGVTTRDGLISSISDPFEGHISDWEIWVESKLQNELLAHAFKANSEEIFLYGDGAYTLQRGSYESIRQHLIQSFQHSKHSLIHLFHAEE